MQISDKEASCQHENEWAAKAACERARHRAYLNLREKFTLREIERERIMRWCECPTKKLAADRALLGHSREHRTFILALKGNSLSTTAVVAQQCKTTERTSGHEYRGHWRPTWEQERKHCSFFALSFSHSCNGHCPTAARNNGIDEWPQE